MSLHRLLSSEQITHLLPDVDDQLIRQWVHRGQLKPFKALVSTDRGLRVVNRYRELDVLICERDRRLANRGRRRGEG